LAVTRKLVAVAVADIVGYSSQMERDEAGTHARLRRLRGDVVGPAIERHRGRLVSTAGDGMLVEFASATDALRWALEVQRALRDADTGDAGEPLRLRIGINLGDLIVDGDDIFGDGLNVAARLESLAEPGGICVSAALRDQIHDELDADYVDGGELRVKNISRPVRVYHVVARDGAAAAPASAPRRALPAWFGRRLAASIAAAAIAIGAAWSWQAWQRTPTSPAAAADRYAVALLPVRAKEGDPAAAKLAAAIGEDYALALGRSLRRADVMQVPDATAAAKARYVVELRVDPGTDGGAVAMRTTAVAKGAEIAGVRTPVPPAMTDEQRSRLVERLVAESREAIAVANHRDHPPAAGTAMHALVQANDAWADREGTVEQLARAQALVDKAIALDPKLPEAWVHRARLIQDSLEVDWRADFDAADAYARMEQAATRATELDPLYEFAWTMRASALAGQSRWAAAIEAADWARKLDPTRGTTHAQAAMIRLRAGEPGEALKLLDERSRFGSAREPDIEMAFAFYACEARLALAQFEAAVAECERSAAFGRHWALDMFIAAAWGQLGETAKAAEAAARLRKSLPGFTIGKFKARFPRKAPAQVEAIAEGLRKAGLPA
jgi:class 3 adenylate cyclase/tetratricopeptide (TPR) repeat protein